MIGLATLSQQRPVFCALLGSVWHPAYHVLPFSAMWQGLGARKAEADRLLAHCKGELTAALRLAWERGV